MFRDVLRAFLIAAFVLGTHQNVQAAPNTPRVMFMTSSYGVMIGTLAGIATLAFYESPSGHSRNVALGASIGLYSGILLGVYIIYLKGDGTPAASDEASLWRVDTATANVVSYSPKLAPHKELIGPNDLLIAPLVSYLPATGTPTFGLSANF